MRGSGCFAAARPDWTPRGPRYVPEGWCEPLSLAILESQSKLSPLAALHARCVAVPSVCHLSCYLLFLILSKANEINTK